GGMPATAVEATANAVGEQAVMWRKPSGCSASPRSCGPSGGGSGWCSSSCWLWTAGSVKLPVPRGRLTRQPDTSQGGKPQSQRPQDVGGAEGALSECQRLSCNKG